MIYKPYNVVPHCTAIDASERNTFSFIFTGDNLKYFDFVFYNAETNELVRRSYVPSKQNTYNNEEMMTLISADTFENGKKYKYKMNLYQKNADIFVVQGKVRSISGTTLPSNQIAITYGISEIESPIYYPIDGTNVLFGACYIEIINNGKKERKMITAYDPTVKYGTDDGYGNMDYKSIITIDSAFSTTPTEGTTYRIYKNYITTPEYYFECASTPEVTPSMTMNVYGVFHCSATFSQEQSVSIKNYQYVLYKDIRERTVIETTVASSGAVSGVEIPIVYPDSGYIDFRKDMYVEITHDENGTERKETRLLESYDYSTNTITVKEPFTFVPDSTCSVVVYTGAMKLVGESPLLYNSSLEWDFDSVLVNTDYKLTIRVTLQNDMSVENTISGHFDSYVSTDNLDDDLAVSCAFNHDKNCVDITHSKPQTQPIIIQQDQITHAETRVIFSSRPERDYLCASNKKYKYRIINIEQIDGKYVYGKEFVTNEVTPKVSYWTICSLKDMDDSYKLHRNCYRAEEVWKLYINPDESEITQNINHFMQSNYGTTPKIVMNNNNYLSGTLTCDITKLECEGMTEFIDDIYLVEAWRKFISENETFLLKNPKGDVMIVSITDNPTTNYNYETSYVPTSITINYAECNKPENVSIIN